MFTVAETSICAGGQGRHSTPDNDNGERIKQRIDAEYGEGVIVPQRSAASNARPEDWSLAKIGEWSKPYKRAPARLKALARC